MNHQFASPKIYLPFLIITIALISCLVYPARTNAAQSSTPTISYASSDSGLIPEAITIVGRCTLENGLGCEGARVELWQGGSSANTIGVGFTGQSGEFQVNDVPTPKVNDIASGYSIQTYKTGFGPDSLIVGRDENGLYARIQDRISYLEINGNTITLPDLVVFRPREVTFQWVYQPDGSAEFSGSGLITGTTTLSSYYHILRPDGERGGSPSNYGFVFQTKQVTGGGDFHFHYDRNDPSIFYANLGSGGIHDMGDTPLESIIFAPDKSRGLGVGRYYDYETKAMVGHTYCVVTADGAHYAKFQVMSIEPYELGQHQDGEPVAFPDPNLEAAIRQTINKSTGPIYDSDVIGLTSLTAEHSNISNLSGLEYCTNLISLNLQTNDIDDISPLASLHNLRELVLRGNSIHDISPLALLTNIEGLYLIGNPIGDISPLFELGNLRALDISFANDTIIDLSPFSTLTNLTSLTIWGGKLVDWTPISNFTSFHHLGLCRCQLSDIVPLSLLANIRSLSLECNHITDISTLTQLSNIFELDLTDNDITDISALAVLTQLGFLFLSDNEITDIAPLSGLTQLNYLWLDGNGISDILPLVENAGLSQGDFLSLERNPLNSDSVNIYIPELQARGVTVYYDASPTDTTPQTPKLTEPVPETITITGRVILEEESSHEDVRIELSMGKSMSDIISSTSTDENGRYEFRDLPTPEINEPPVGYRVIALKPGFAYDLRYLYRNPYGFYSTHRFWDDGKMMEPIYLELDGSMVSLPDLVLVRPKQVSFEWVYQPDGTPSFSGLGLASGSATLVSSYTTELGESFPHPSSSWNCGFAFSTQTTKDYVADFNLGNSREESLSLYARNGEGGIHDMGNVSLESVVTAPDRSLGVGWHEYYNTHATNVIVGHTYCVVTMDGTHYAKFRITSIEAYQLNQPPQAPVITYPGSDSEPGPVLSTLTPTLELNNISGADYCALTISKYPYGPLNIVYNLKQLTTASHTVGIGPLVAGEKYRWNIQAHSLGGWSSISNTLYFQTAPSPSEDTSSLYVLTIRTNDCGTIDVSPSGEVNTGQPILAISPNTGYVYGRLCYFKPGSEVELEAQPNTGYNFHQWEGITTSTNNPLVINIDRDKEIGACFIHESIYGTLQVANLDEAELTFLGRAIREVLAMQTLSIADDKEREWLSLIDELAEEIENHPVEKVRNIITDKTEEQEIVEDLATGVAEKLSIWAVGAGAALLSPPVLIAAILIYPIAELAKDYIPEIVEQLTMRNLGTVELHEAGKASIWVIYDRENMEAIVNIDLFSDFPQRIQMVIPFESAYEETAGSTIPAYPWGYAVDGETVWFHYTTIDIIQVTGGSPVEIRILDADERASGIRNGEVVAEIPGSTYREGIITILYLSQPDLYSYEVAGIGEGSYSYTITITTEGVTREFTATDIPTISGSLHRYNINWYTLAKGENGTIIKIDSDGNGEFETTVLADTEFSNKDYAYSLRSSNWQLVVGIVIGIIVISFGIYLVVRFL